MATQLISASYLAQQRWLHRSGDYGRGGARWADVVCNLMDAIGTSHVLDYGCGKGFLGAEMAARGRQIAEYDPAIPGKTWAVPADLVIATDVMEHIEPERLDVVLAHLIEVTRVALFVSISTRLAGKVLLDGRNAHLIIQPDDWWRKKFEAVGFRVKRVWPTTEQEWVATMLPPRECLPDTR